MPSTTLLDACGRRRSPATLSSFHQGLPPRNNGQRYPADPPTVEEIIAVMHAAGDDHDRAVRLRGLIVVLWRAGLRISEALALKESDLDAHRGALLIRHGKGDICRIRHIRPYVASRTMLRAAAEGTLAAGIGVAGWTYFLMLRGSRGRRAAGRVAGSVRA